jgi:hypothetical protein
MSKSKLYCCLPIFFLIALLLSIYFGYQSGWLQQRILQKAINEFSPNNVNVELAGSALGFDSPRYYLVLFLNNTEIRPGGGFIGSYAVVKVIKGKPELMVIEGSERLDNAHGPTNVPPPIPIKEHLSLESWFFRDSNWSPDFAASAQKSLELYQLEKGTAADKITGVIGVTPTAIEEILKISGPVRAADLEFSSKNFTRQLEQEVEFGYQEKGISFNDRKEILWELSLAIVEKVKVDFLSNLNRYLALGQRMIKEKHLMFYSISEQEQVILQKNGWAGKLKKTNGDYLLWVDANLGALKTDAAIERLLKYSIEKNEKGAYVATATMTYNQPLPRDKFTTRYFNYVRVFVPKGSKLISTSGTRVSRKDETKDKIDQGLESGYQWFGAFSIVEPETTHTVSFTYSLAPELTKQIENGGYNLLVQKQLGLESHKLTIDHNFGKTIGPGSNELEYVGDFIVDRVFEVTP